MHFCSEKRTSQALADVQAAESMHQQDAAQRRAAMQAFYAQAMSEQRMAEGQLSRVYAEGQAVE